MKKLRFWWLMIAALTISTNSRAQNFIKTDVGFTLSQGRSFIQSFDFNLNRTDEVQNSSGGVYFLYSRNRFYIIPTVDVNLGQSLTATNNNIVTQISFGKRFKDDKIKSENQLNESYFKAALEINPTYNADKTFLEKLYYTQIKLILNPVFSHYDSDLNQHYLKRVLSLGIDPILNVGTHNSQTYQTNQLYSAAGISTALILRLNKKNGQIKTYENWVFKLSGSGYRLFSEIKSLYPRNYYGQLIANIDKAVNPKISINTTYKYGNDNPNYSTINALTLGFKYKY